MTMIPFTREIAHAIAIAEGKLQEWTQNPSPEVKREKRYILIYRYGVSQDGTQIRDDWQSFLPRPIAPQPNPNPSVVTNADVVKFLREHENAGPAAGGQQPAAAAVTNPNPPALAGGGGGNQPPIGVVRPQGWFGRNWAWLMPTVALLVVVSVLVASQFGGGKDVKPYDPARDQLAQPVLKPPGQKK